MDALNLRGHLGTRDKIFSVARSARAIQNTELRIGDKHAQGGNSPSRETRSLNGF